MQKNKSHFATTISKTLTLLTVLGLLLMSGCNVKNGDGTVLILELDNTENIHQYWVFNPYNSTIERCKETAEEAIAQILASNDVPKDSKVTSWRCSFKPPENDK